MDIDCLINQLSTLITMEDSSGTNWLMSCVAVKDNYKHQYRIPPCQ